MLADTKLPPSDEMPLAAAANAESYMAGPSFLAMCMKYRARSVLASAAHRVGSPPNDASLLRAPALVGPVAPSSTMAVDNLVRMLSYTCCWGSSAGCGYLAEFPAWEYGTSPQISASVPTRSASSTYA